MTKSVNHFIYSPRQLYLRYFPIRSGKQRPLNATWRIAASDRNLVTTLTQAKVKMVIDLTQYVQRRIYFWGSYEQEMCTYWMQATATAKVAFDVGANVGIYTLLAVTNPQITVHAFEPTTAIANRLLHNLKVNRLSNVIVNIAGVGKSTTTAFLHECKGHTGNNEGMNFVTTNQSNHSDIPVSITTLDDYCEQHSIKQIDMLKLDIEGGEYDALLGTTSLLRRKAIKQIVIELCEWATNRSNSSTVDIKHLFKDVGYGLYGLRQGKLYRVDNDYPEEGSNFIAIPSLSVENGTIL